MIEFLQSLDPYKFTLVTIFASLFLLLLGKEAVAIVRDRVKQGEGSPSLMAYLNEKFTNFQTQLDQIRSEVKEVRSETQVGFREANRRIDRLNEKRDQEDPDVREEGLHQ